MALQNELRPFSVNVCALLPGDVRTGFTAAREPEYSCETMLIPLEQVANAEKTFPLEWITPGGVSDEFRAYCLPLIGEYDTRFVSLR